MDTDEDEDTLQGNFSNEMHLLDLTKQIWRPVELKVPKTKKTDKQNLPNNETMDSTEESQAATVSSDGVFTMVVGQKTATKSDVQKKSSSGAGSSSSAPSPRMKSGLTVCKGNLYVYGGIVEDGNKQVTLADFYSIGKNKAIFLSLKYFFIFT